MFRNALWDRADNFIHSIDKGVFDSVTALINILGGKRSVRCLSHFGITNVPDDNWIVEVPCTEFGRPTLCFSASKTVAKVNASDGTRRSDDGPFETVS